MEKKIKEINNYFRDKIVKGDYEVKTKGTHTWSIIIDEKYHFGLWICNGSSAFSIYQFDSFKPAFMNIEFREADKKAAFKRISKAIDENIIEIKKAQLEKLKIELGE